MNKYVFSDPSIDRVECDGSIQLLVHINSDYGGEYLWLPKRDVIAMAKALGITGKDFIKVKDNE